MSTLFVLKIIAKPEKIRDGVVFRNVRFYMAKPDPTRIAVAQAWMNTLSGPKKHALALMIGRPTIMAALDGMLPFPGHWNGMMLGNWAKHLAAHIDPAVANYWEHMKTTWAKIMLNDESMYHLVTANDVTRLQHRAPAWSSSDRHYVQNAFAAHQLFPLVHEAAKREKILHNILELQCVIPSIQTFHENMRYITIGAKILEKLIQMPQKKRAKDTVDRGSITLYDNLIRHWATPSNVVQIADARYAERFGPPEPYVAFLVLFIAALRNFPHLSSERALLGNEKEENREQPQIREHTRLLCNVARELGFDNKKVERGCSIGCGQVETNPAYRPPLGWGDWRAGTPSIVALKLLAKQSFFPHIYAGPPPKCNNVGPFHIFSDLMRAFFPYSGSISTIEATIPIDVDDAAMDDAGSVVEHDILGEGNDTDDIMGEESGGEDAWGEENDVEDMDVDEYGQPHALQKVRRKPVNPLAKPKSKEKRKDGNKPVRDKQIARKDGNKPARDKQIAESSIKKVQKVTAEKQQTLRKQLKRHAEATVAANGHGNTTITPNNLVTDSPGIEIPSVQSAVAPLGILLFLKLTYKLLTLVETRFAEAYR